MFGHNTNDDSNNPQATMGSAPVQSPTGQNNSNNPQAAQSQQHANFINNPVAQSQTAGPPPTNGPPKMGDPFAQPEPTSTPTSTVGSPTPLNSAFQSADPVIAPPNPDTNLNDSNNNGGDPNSGSAPLLKHQSPSILAPQTQNKGGSDDSNTALGTPSSPISGSNLASNASKPTLADPVDHDKLADMKKQALDHLEPLADHIKGTPTETFRTTMMMIQANDNHTLLEKALESAKKIDDDKARAEAMLDIINEINYFSQNN